MSFSTETKNELAHIVPEKKCCTLAEIAGFIRMCGSIRLAGGGRFKIVMTTNNAATARHYKTLIKAYFNADANIRVGQGLSLKKSRTYFLTVEPEDMSEMILRETGILMVSGGMNYISDGIYEGIIKTKCCKKAYLRGLFLGGGTITNPEKAYDIEFVCGSKILGGDVKKLINSFADLHSKVIERKNTFVVYIKEIDQIIDLMAIMGAHSRVFTMEDIRITREMRNAANRLNNCDQANIDKTVKAAEKQIMNIKKISEAKGLDYLPEKLREAAVVRMENPVATLAELAEMMDPPLKKSGLNNRLKKIEEIAQRL